MSARYPLSRLQYERAVDAGIFEPDARLELVDGTLVPKARETPGHATGTGLIESCLRHAFDSGCHLRIKHPLAADDYSDPEPDLTVVSGGIRDYLNAHPTTAVLVVEIADDTLQYDRTVKQRLYARCGIPEYWKPRARRGPPRRRQARRRRHPSRPARPDARVDIADLLPSRAETVDDLRFSRDTGPRRATGTG